MIRYYFITYIILTVHLVGYSQDIPIEDTVLLKDKIFEYSELGFNYLQTTVNLDSAEFYLKEAIKLQLKTSQFSSDDRIANNYTALSTVYRYIYNTEEALKYSNIAEQILLNYDPNHRNLGTVYHNKGNIYKIQGDLYKTKEYYEYSLDLLVRNGYADKFDFAFIFSNYIDLLLEMEEYDLAKQQLSTFDLSKMDIPSVIEFRIENTNATSYSQLGDYEKAISHFKMASEILKDDPEIMNSSRDMMNYYYNVIDFHTKYGDYEEALAECTSAYLFIDSLDPHSRRARILYESDIDYRSAVISYLQNDLKTASSKALLAIDNLNTFLGTIATSTTLSSKINRLTTSLPDLYVLRSQISLHLFKKSNNKEDLKASYTAYTNAIDMLNIMKLAMGNENSKLFATSQILDVYNEAIYVGLLLHNLTDENAYLEQAFEFAEASKSFALYSEIKDMEAMQFSDLPAEIKNQEIRMTTNIEKNEEALYKAQIASEPDLQLIADLKDVLFHLKDDYEDLKREIALNNAKYYELKYMPNFVSLEEVQEKLPHKDALIEYVLSDTMLITFVIDKKGINIISQEIDPEFADECIEYYQLLHDQNFSSGVTQNFRRFVSLGRKFYKILIEPSLKFTDRENLTIVPDGAITYIPFEGLMSEDVLDTININYMTLPYMIRDYSVGYSHSSTLMFNQRMKTRPTKAKVLAFAPNYKNTLHGIDTALYRQVSEANEYLPPLEGTIKEVQSIKETVPADVFLNETATEANFKKYAKDYNVLHLAMHTRMKDDNPLYSLLAFTNVESGEVEDTTDQEDNKLYAYEIYNMTLNAQMAVLSSCNSGFGKMQKGEGMMSLGRGFIYAGCPSIIMTLWQVADKSSSELMTSFYKHLKKGKSKQEALRMAKIDYLETADDLTSNPYFWSGFVVLGDSSPIYRKSGVAYWMIVIALFAGIMIFIQYRRS